MVQQRREVKSAARVIALFEYFAERQTPATIAELTRNLGIPQASMTMLARNLVDLGYLIHDPRSRSYFPSMRLPLLGSWMQRRFPQTGRLPKLLQRLSAESGQSVVLAMRNGINARYLLVQQASSPLAMAVRSGFVVPLACSATGWVLLMKESDREISKIIRRTQVETHVELWRKTAVNAAENIKTTRENGFAVTRGETERGRSAIAIPISGIDNKSVRLTIAIGGDQKVMEQNEQVFLSMLRATAEMAEEEDVSALLAANEGE